MRTSHNPAMIIRMPANLAKPVTHVLGSFPAPIGSDLACVLIVDHSRLRVLCTSTLACEGLPRPIRQG